MRDRFPLFLVAGILLSALVGTALVRSARRGDFADTLSSYRSREGGARALYLLAERNGLPVERRMADLRQLQPGEALVLFGVDFADAHDRTPEETELVDAPDAGTSSDDTPREGFNSFLAPGLDEAELESVLEHLRGGGVALYAPWGARENGLLDALGVELRKADPELGSRTLVPARLTPWTRGLQRVESPVQSFLRLAPNAIPLLVDFQLEAPVAAWVPLDEGGVFVVTAPELFDNAHVGLADNAHFALQLLAGLGPDTRIQFDEYHHGFRDERSLVDFASRYGLQWALLQLLLGLLLWAASLRRFGPAQVPDEERRHTRVELLSASARLYREGRHHRWAAGLLARHLTQSFASLAGVRPRAPHPEVLSGLRTRGLETLAHSLERVCALAESAEDAGDVLATARATAFAHRQAQKRRAPSPPVTPEEDRAA